MCRFDAPLDFDPMLRSEFDRFDDSVWVCNPSGLYITGAQLDGVKILATPSTGTNHIDLAECERRGIKVLSLLDDRVALECISASAEWTFKLILEGLRLKRPYMELQGKCVGLVGHGRIGRRIEQWCQAFGAYAWWRDPMTGDSPGLAILYRNGGVVPLRPLFSLCDVVVVCCSLTEQTQGMVTGELIGLMPRNAVLVNTARAEIIDEQGLYEVLQARPDIRFLTDVVHGEVEGRAEESRVRLRELGAYVSSHIAGDTYESRTKATRIILELLKKETGEKCESPLSATA